MTKLNKKTMSKKKELKSKSSHTLKKRSKIKTKPKDCFVNLIKMTKTEYEVYSNPDVIKPASFHLKISGDNLQISDHGHGTQTQHSKTATFNIILKRRLGSYVLENSVTPIVSCTYKVHIPYI